MAARCMLGPRKPTMPTNCERKLTKLRRHRLGRRHSSPPPPHHPPLRPLLLSRKGTCRCRHRWYERCRCRSRDGDSHVVSEHEVVPLAHHHSTATAACGHHWRTVCACCSAVGAPRRTVARGASGGSVPSRIVVVSGRRLAPHGASHSNEQVRGVSKSSSVVVL